MPGEFEVHDGSEFVAPTSNSAENIENKGNARETMITAMQNVEKAIAAIRPLPGENSEDLLLRVRATIHDAAFREVNRPE
jgi:hypothetical protein